MPQATASEWEQRILLAKPLWRQQWAKRMAAETRRLPKPISEMDRFRIVKLLAVELGNTEAGAILRRGFKRASAAKRLGLCKLEEEVEAAQIHLAKTAKASQKSSPRRLAEKDRKYVDLLGRLEKSGDLKNRRLVVEEIKKEIGNYKVPDWRRATISLKLLALCIEVHKRGGIAFTLRLSNDVIKRSEEDGRGQVSYLQDRIRKNLKAVFGHCPDFCFIMEKDTLSPLHLHGVIDIRTDDPRKLDAEKALMRAGGCWTSTNAHLYQNRFDDLYGPYGWASYLSKAILVTRLEVSSKLFGVTSGLRTVVEGEWASLRATLPQT
ncbi:hypothetical protein [uncultured Brevundimonas sp.]|uniref:hypothetical protein n=1 Tax=uncultured Brevundimonas sp. TaxID=213418 RepID=UPI002639BAD5|nr:hypothetical protein [uncultured Brevundimonas sp.]